MISAPSADAPRSVTILGATGSVGASTVDLISRSPERFTVEAVTANKDAERLAAIARQLGARYAAVADDAAYPALKAALSGSGIEAAGGAEAVVAAAARPADWVMAAIVGAAGLPPILTAVRRGAMVAFANKECLVCAGDLMMAEVRRHGATLLPVDSEHNAIFQVLQPGAKVRRLILTASGGPFREWSREQMAAATPAQAVAHPNWSMGAKISVDSATLMNKGLELIEASHLFAMPEDRIEIVVHPQSVIHSLVDYADGSVLAQLGVPDMRVPIAYTLAWPERMETPCAALDLAKIARLDFQPPDAERFPALRLTRECLRQGGSAATVLNAANEVAVAAFLEGRIGFLDIERIVEATLAMIPAQAVATLDEVFAIDAAARRHAAAL
ncbi:1-deoxy-D-xylulose-5-phosphate reductoisomerase [Mycobacterium sp. KBS0706]|uniref:1-deoxy-D-xylulose-5-phosphate reductoisomerase n=1 Tax=Mycobacterium sp. KBS0706 TaxID=2578109 RepID=UPI00110F8E57|nr:1-deoxy-D-xylulose-5-phosphate reductoisomerase [Mycobacterium sp. KBS0706]TSD87947.1 1-deoxy-D-xylulose-5-phosphate reductoisomerase [Mycobacterium sp. KBS0706]